MPGKSKFDADRWFNNFTWSRELLGLRPHEISEAITRAKMAGNEPLELLLAELTAEATKALDADPPSLEVEAWNVKQENALAVLEHGSNIRKFLACLSEADSAAIQTTTILRPTELGKSESRTRRLSEIELGRQIAIEAMRFALSAVAGDFWSNLWPATKQGAASAQHLHQAAPNALKKKQTLAAEKRALCRDLACSKYLHLRIGTAAEKIYHYIREHKSLQQPPKPRTIERYIQNLFPEHLRKKASR